MKLKAKSICKAFALLMTLTFFIGQPSVSYASENICDVPVFYDTEQGRFVNDLDRYIEMLNSNEISPFNPIIETYDVTPFTIEEPSKLCSNIFGHKWGSWYSWSVWNTVTYPSGKQCVWMERYRYCERTFCGASQREIDEIWIN